MKRHKNSFCCIGWSMCTCNGPTWQKSWLCFLEDRCMKWGHSGIRDFFTSQQFTVPRLLTHCDNRWEEVIGRVRLWRWIISFHYQPQKKEDSKKIRREDITSNSRESERDASRRATRAITWFGYTHTANHCVSSFILCVCVCVFLYFFSLKPSALFNWSIERIVFSIVCIYSVAHTVTRAAGSSSR